MMMTQGNRSLHVSGSKVTPDVQMDVNAPNAFNHMKQELITYQVENKKLTEQLNCLVSLIKRSWSGDKHATVHLSNIVGLEPPRNYPVPDGSIARPNSQMHPGPSSKEIRCQQNWERLAMRLLDREYQAVQHEIREYQQRYIENRQAYTDAVLQDHHQSMGRIPLHRKPDPLQAMEELDSKFIKHNKALQRMGTSAGGHYRKVQSAGYRRRVPPVHEVVEQAEVSLRELVGETPSSDHFLVGQKTSEPRTITPSAYVKRRPATSVHSRQPPPNTYNDPGRYAQNDLFRPNESDGVKRPRPVSASSLREGDTIRSRPRSGRAISANIKDKQQEKTVFITQTNERPLKYETTRPVKPKSAKQRRNSTGSASKKSANVPKVSIKPQTDVISATSKAMGPSAPSEEGNPDASQSQGDRFNHEDADGFTLPQQDRRGEEFQGSDSDDFDMAAKPPVAVRVKSAFTRRPAFIDEFANDEKVMKDMEEDFKKTALNLQKKLGITETGIVTYD